MSPARTRRSRHASEREALERLYTKDEAAAALNVSLRFVERCITQRRIRFVRVGRHIRIPESALVELIDLGTVPSS